MTDLGPSPPEDNDADMDRHHAERIDPAQQDVSPNTHDLHAKHSLHEHRRLLELQLRKLRSEASAARLDAKAAEIELMIRRLSDESSEFASTRSIDSQAEPSSLDFFETPAKPHQPGSHQAGSHQAGSHQAGSHQAGPHQAGSPSTGPHHTGPHHTGPHHTGPHHTGPHHTGSPSTELPNIGPPAFRDWNDVRGAMRLRNEATYISETWTRADSAHSVRRHHFDTTTPDQETPDQEASTASEALTQSFAEQLPEDPGSEPSEKADTADLPDAKAAILPLDLSAIRVHDANAVPVALDSPFAEEVQIDADTEDDDAQATRTRPGAWLVSALAHVAILILLALMGLSQHRPKDQVALTASAPATEQVSMETFEIETSEPQTDPQPNEPNPADVQYELSPVGEISASEMMTDAPPAPASSSMASMLSRSNAASSSMSMKPNSDATMEFCGVKGGGNHFVYLVDSSGSMGDAFDSARAELLRSIDLLKPEQRFYVIFFDAEPDYMRLTDANTDEPRSVNASRVNRDALKRWAMRISKDRGRAPYDALRFALKLKPDVIFLLSDGEFPQGIEDLLKEENKIVNLFGDDDPISIVHTISYHSVEGESRMKRIAEQNQGMYRHVPKP